MNTGRHMNKAEDVIRKYADYVASLSEESRNKPFVACACGEHLYSPQSMLNAMRDPDDEEGQLFLNAILTLSNTLAAL